MALTEADIRRLASPYPWNVDSVVKIAWRESRFEPTAHALDSDDDSWGLMQINMKDTLGVNRLRMYGLNSKADLLNPETNMRVAYEIYKENGNSFLGSAAWMVVPLTGPPGYTGDDDDDWSPADETAYEALVQKAMVELSVDHDEAVDRLFAMSLWPSKQSWMSDAEWELLKRWKDSHVASQNPLETAGDVVGAATDVVLPWAEALGKLLSKLISLSFWKQVGLAVLGVLLVLIAVAFFMKDEINPLGGS